MSNDSSANLPPYMDSPPVPVPRVGVKGWVEGEGEGEGEGENEGDSKGEPP